MKTSKLILVFFLGITLTTGCKSIFDDENAKADIHQGRTITVQELNLVPYQLNDQVSFKNSSDDVLNYTCINRDHYRDTYDPNARCGANVEHCDIYVYDHLNIELKCLNDTTKNIRISYKGGYYLEFSFPNLDSYNNIIAQPDSTSSCKIRMQKFPEVENICIDSSLIENKKYYDITKIIITPNTSNHINSIDTIYYNKDKGILKFCLDDVIWLKQ